MHDHIREAPLGQLIRFLSRNRYLKYPEEEPGFQLPEAWQQLANELDDSPNVSGEQTKREEESRQDRSGEGRLRAIDEDSADQRQQGGREEENGEVRGAYDRSLWTDQIQTTGDDEHTLGGEEVEKVRSTPIVPRRTKDGYILVDWYYSDDPANPHNWSNWRRARVSIIICMYTFVVYASSAIYTSSQLEIERIFHVSPVKSSLGLSLYVLGYGVGPLIFSPLSEVPIIGRNPVYIATMFLFVVLSIPTALADNYAGLMVLRFITGFFGSPCLASGGASLGDLYSFMGLPYAMMAWVAAAYCGPALGPLLSAFAVPAENWRWSIYISIWASAPVFIAMFLWLPETSSPNILLRRARRLRKLTGNQRFLSQSEIDQRDMKVGAIVVDALIKPIEITVKDPAILFVQVYTAIIYGIYYSFFEVFPLVYPVYYGFSLGDIGLVFLCVLVSCVIAIIVYASYLYYYQDPRIRKFGFPVQEKRLIPALPMAVGPTIGLFLFAWSSRPSIHWIVPTIGITIYGGTVFIVMQCIFVYIPLSYPSYAASLFAANDFFRSALACGSILFAHPLYANLGVGRGTSLLGGLSVIGIIGIWLLYFFGARLRAMSKFAISSEETFAEGQDKGEENVS